MLECSPLDGNSEVRDGESSDGFDRSIAKLGEAAEYAINQSGHLVVIED
jgi:hypothetical protein